MNPLRVIIARLRGFVRRDAIADEIREELTTHLDARTQQYEREGHPRSDAERLARQRMGNLAVHLDRGYDVRGGGAIDAVTRDLKWAWRGVRVRGWRAAAVAGLLGLTLAANAVVFSAADAFVFHTVPYANPESLVVIQRTSSTGPSDYMSRDAMLAWREHSDLLARIEGHDSGIAAYVKFGDIVENVFVQQVTPGLFGLLGVLPEFGRPLTEADAERGAPPVVLISHAFARRLFGTAAGAVGQSFATGHYNGAGAITPTVVGVMPASFRFPTATEEIWQPLDLSRWPSDTGIRHVARLSPRHTLATAAPLVLERLAVIPESRSRAGRSAELRSLADFRRNVDARGVFAVLIAAASCLLFIACANVASLELAAGARQHRDNAVRATLGASRSSLVRVALFETAFVLVASLGSAVILAVWGSGVLAGQLTGPMRAALANPLDVDGRAAAYMVGVTAVTWMLIAIPAALRSTRASVVTGLRDDPRVQPASAASARTRQWLMTGQVALTVVLLVGALLFIRTYWAKVGRDVGFDAARIATIEVFYAPEVLGRHGEMTDVLLDRLRHSEGVLSVARTTNLPPSTQTGVNGPLRLNGAAEPVGRPFLSPYTVDPEYFRTMGIVPVQGRLFDDSSPVDDVVIDEAFARRFWPDGQAVGSRFEVSGTRIARLAEFRVIGVSRQLRSDRTATAGGDDVFVVYVRLPKEHPVVSRFVARLDDERRLDAVAALVRSTTEHAVVRIDTVEARYARLDGGPRLAATITSGFGAMALLIAASGIYAVMAFLVASRSREIGIRMALGAEPAAVRRMVLTSSLRFVSFGTILGLVAALLAGRVVASQLFGVSSTDPATYAVVGTLVFGTALVATLWPARRASRVDPAIALRSE